LELIDILSTWPIFGSAEYFQAFRLKKTIFSFAQPVNFDKIEGLSVFFSPFQVKFGGKRNIITKIIVC